MTHEPSDTGETGQGPELTRRKALASTGLVLAGGVGLAAAGSAAAAGARTLDEVALAPTGSTAVEFRVRIAQSGPAGGAFAGFGYLIRVQGVPASDVFAGSTLNEGTALLTAYATGSLLRRVLDQNVHSLDIAGELAVYQRSAPGATFADPGSFQQGRLVARFAISLQDVLAVFAPNQGIPTLTGDMRQTVARRLQGGGAAGRVFGRRGSRARFLATGLGRLVDPATLNAELEMAGNWTTE
jgi:hypothetical protein